MRKLLAGARRMTRRRPPPFAVLGLAAVASWAFQACGTQSQDTPRSRGADEIQVVDAAGRTWVLPGPATRVISLVPSATATLLAIGAQDVLVGRTDFDTDSWLEGIPSVGGGLEPSMEVIVSLEPDLVIRFAGEQDAITPARLDQLGIPHVAVRPDRVDDVFVATTLLGEVTGHRSEAALVVDGIRTGLERLRERVSSLPRLKVVYVMGSRPPWVAGPNTYIDEVISLAGGDNVFSDLATLYASVSLEELRARDIDVVLVPDRAAFDPSITPGARVEEVGELLEIPGPRVLDAARSVARLLHGDALR